MTFIEQQQKQQNYNYENNDKHEYLTVEEILLEEIILIKGNLQNKFTDSPLGRAFEKQAKKLRSKGKIRSKQEL